MLVILIISVAILFIANFQLRRKLCNTDRYLGSRIIEFSQKFNDVDGSDDGLRGRILCLEHDFEELQAHYSQLEQDFVSLVAATLPTPTQLEALESRLTRKLAETDKLTRKDIKELFNRSKRRLRLRRV